MDIKKYEKIIEGLLYLTGSDGISFAELQTTLNIEDSLIDKALENLKIRLQEDSGLDLLQTNNTYKLVTKDVYYEYYQKYANLYENQKIGQSALETLAIIAYKQPITKSDIEDIKGVGIQHNLSLLNNKNLVEIVGKSSEIGKPNLYGVTSKFLDFVGINDLKELPELTEFEFRDKQSTLLNFEELNFKELSKKILNDTNTIKIKEIDQELINDLDSINELNIDFELKGD